MINTDIYKKEFTNLGNGVEEIREFIKEKDCSLNDLNFDGCSSFLEEYKRLASHCTNILYDGLNFPDIMDENFPNVYGLGIFGNKFYFRTKGIFSFSFDIDTRNFDGENLTISMYIYIKRPRNPMASISYNKIVDKFKEAGWEFYDAPKRDFKKNDSRTEKLQNSVKKKDIDSEKITTIIANTSDDERKVLANAFAEMEAVDNS